MNALLPPKGVVITQDTIILFMKGSKTMKKSVVKIVALLMVTISVLALPLTAGATAYSGGYSGINYVAHTGGSNISISSDISTDANAALYLYIRPMIYYKVNGSWLCHGYESYDTSTANSNHFSVSFSYVQFAIMKGLNKSGKFTESYYTDKINGHSVISDVTETF